MAAASSLLSEDHFLCSICLDVFTEPVTVPCGHNFCRNCITEHWDISVQCICPMCKKLFCSRPELFVNTVISEMAAGIKEISGAELGQKEAEVQQMIRERRLKIEQMERSVKLSREDADRETAESVQVFTALIQSVQRSLDERIDMIQQEQKTTEEQAEGFIRELEEEILKLTKRSSELEQLSRNGDHLQFLQSFPYHNPAPPTKDWKKISVYPSSERTVWTAVAQLEETLSKEIEKLCVCAELKRVQQYAVDVTLDPDTANPYLILSDDGKRVKCGDVRKNVPDNPERFSSCAVLGKQSFSSGRFYYEVKVKGKTKWDLGVAGESVNRKGESTLCPENGYWAIWLRNGNEYRALAGPSVRLLLKSKPERVGVFVDYEGGLVFFYDADAAELIFSFTGCDFTEKLYPYFSPCPSDGGRNSRSLVLS
uniref:Uncharacterized protein n=1 Tax=Sparus aurata TaxID=8175 RepID=A0A671YLH8_SPAAU